LLEIIKLRRSTRAFDGRPVPRADIEKLLEAAIWAPSGRNNQTWLFTAIINRGIVAIGYIARPSPAPARKAGTFRVVE
jgi:nitroreductase